MHTLLAHVQLPSPSIPVTFLIGLCSLKIKFLLLMENKVTNRFSQTKYSYKQVKPNKAQVSPLLLRNEGKEQGFLPSLYKQTFLGG